MATEKVFEKILVPVDNSKYAVGAARLAIQVAQVHGAQVIFLHVVDARAIEMMAKFGHESQEALLSRAEESGWKILYNLEEEAVSQQVRVALILEEGAPQHAILDAAEKYQADLIVLGKHRKEWSRKDIIVPSIIENAECAVLVAK